MEIYKSVPENPNYAISNLGNFKNIKTGVIHVPKTSWGNYWTASFPINGKRTSKSYHQMVARAFCPNPDNKKVVNHKNGNKYDNRAENLEWCTQSENNKHAYDTGLKKYRPLHYKGKFGADHNRSKTVFQYTEDGMFVKEYGSVSEAARSLGVGFCNIAQSANRKLFSSHGFVWSYTKLNRDNFPPKPPPPNRVRVAMKDANGNTIRIFDSFKDAAKFVGCHKSCISSCVLGYVKRIKGYKWEYAI